MTHIHLVPAPRSIASKRVLHNASVKLLPLLLAAALSGCATKALHSGAGVGSANSAGGKSAAADGRTGGAGAGSTASDLSAKPGGPAGQGAGVNGSSAQGAGGKNADGSDAPGSSSSSDGTGAGGKNRSAGGQSSAFADGGTSGDGGPDGAGGTSGQSADGTAGGASNRNADGTSNGRSGAGNAAGGAAGAGAAGAAGGTSADGSTAAGAGGRGVNGAGGEASGVAGAGEGADGNSASGMAGADSVGGDSRVASIDVPSGNVKVDEDYRPQTLGGMLPLVIGVNEDGRFDFDQYALRPEVKKALDELAAQLKTAEYDRLDIIGYTDRIGTTEYNKRLSELRAWSVAQYLISQSVPENKIRYEGRGDKNPITQPDECTGLARGELITCLQKDRRVEIEASIHRKHATVLQ